MTQNSNTPDLALSTCSAASLRNEIDFDVVIGGALWHDFGKDWDYLPNRKASPMTADPEVPAFVYTAVSMSS